MIDVSRNPAGVDKDPQVSDLFTLYRQDSAKVVPIKKRDCNHKAAVSISDFQFFLSLPWKVDVANSLSGHLPNRHPQLFRSGTPDKVPSVKDAMNSQIRKKRESIGNR